MIDYQLKKCCNECSYLDFDYEQRRVDWDMCHPDALETVIFCKHAGVCEKYNKQTSGRYKWEED